MRILAPVLLALALASPAGSETTRDDAWAYALAHELMSPYCPGRSLAECPSPQADQLRLWIIEQARAGATRSEVETELFRNFGDQLRQTPRAEGIGLIAYLVPAACVVLGGVLLAVFLRRSGGARSGDA